MTDPEKSEISRFFEIGATEKVDLRFKKATSRDNTFFIILEKND